MVGRRAGRWGGGGGNGEKGEREEERVGGREEERVGGREEERVGGSEEERVGGSEEERVGGSEGSEGSEVGGRESENCFSACLKRLENRREHSIHSKRMTGVHVGGRNLGEPVHHSITCKIGTKFSTVLCVFDLDCRKVYKSWLGAGRSVQSMLRRGQRHLICVESKRCHGGG